MLSFLSTFAATLFALLNPLGMMPVFIGYTAGRAAVSNLVGAVCGADGAGSDGAVSNQRRGHSQLLCHYPGLVSGRRGILLLLIAINTVTGDPNKSAKEFAAQAQTSALGEAKLMFRQIVVPHWWVPG